MEFDRKPLERRFQDLRANRQPWEAAWKDLQTYICPVRGLFDTPPNQSVALDHKKLTDGEPMAAAGTLASGMLSGLTSPAMPWFSLCVADPDLNDYGPVRIWLDRVREILLAVFAKSRIYNNLYDLYEEQGVFATGCASIVADFENVIRGRTYTCGEYYLAPDEFGRIRTFGRIIYMSVENLVRRFGKENVSNATRQNFDSNHLHVPVRVFHLIEPNDGRDPARADNRNMAFRSVYWEEGQEADRVLRVSGFRRFPVVAPRWGVRTAAEAYGRGSPGWKALGDSKSLQVESRDKLKGIAKVVDPPMQAPPGMKNEIINALPGGVTYVQEMSNDKYVKPLYAINLPLNELRADIQDLREKINRYFYTDLFRLLQQSQRPQKTAYEIAALHEEKVLVLSPVIESNEEMLDQMIELAFAACQEAGILPEPPEELAGADLTVDYISALAQAQKMIGVTGMIDTINLGISMAASFPDVLDNIDSDEAISEYSSRVGAPAKMIRSREAVAQLRQKRAQEQAAQQQLANAAAAIEGAKNLSQASLDRPSALTALLGGSAGAGGGMV